MPGFVSTRFYSVRPRLPFCRRVRRWLAEHRHEIAAATGRRYPRYGEVRARDSARAKLAIALRRGTFKRGCSRVCEDAELIGLIAEAAALAGGGCGSVGSTGKPSAPFDAMKRSNAPWPSSMASQHKPRTLQP